MFKVIKKYFKKVSHRCNPIEYPETREIIIFHYDIPWLFSQMFTVCKECHKVKVLSEIINDNRSILGEYKKEIDGTKWSGNSDYAKVPSIGRDKLIISKSFPGK